MLANSIHAFTRCGALRADLHLPITILDRLLEFIADNLPLWRDDPERRHETSETTLTEQLTNYLAGAARFSDGFDIFQFQNEVEDEHCKGRKLDMAVKPCGVNIHIGTTCYSQYQCLLPIECKRLPTPKGTKRDEREYVINGYASTGGIQRFKAGHHGGKHTLGIMIAYIQEETATHWHKRITSWIQEIVNAGTRGWTSKDALDFEHEVESAGLTVYRSSHSRPDDLSDIQLRHLWLRMN